MKKLALVPVVWVWIFLFSCSEKKALDNTFYCFNNAVRTLPNAPEGHDAQAALIKKLGFDGFSGHITDDYFKRRASLDKVGLKMPEMYWGMTLTEDGEITYEEGIREIIKDSKGRDLLVALFLISQSYMDNKDEGDPLMAAGIRELADYAAQYDVKVAIYPHVNQYCETSAHSVKLAKLVERDNVGAIFNTCHFLKVEGEEGLEEKVLAVLPYLYMVSLSGADSGNTQEMTWERLIQPLGEGTFDTYKLVKLLKDNGYGGLFGLQCYNIKQDCEFALTQSMNTWRTYQERYQNE